ncbi:MAG: DUF763 domain-containing protein [Planctomycetota bacterium]|nr:DUF763 domain-containing protein [Planctomycetota bacterium]
MAQLPLHTGKAPPWLFRRMTRLAGGIATAIVEEFGEQELLRRLSDPWWFQTFGCVLGFDWHSSGLTTVTCGALKEASRTIGQDLGILVAGGKGGTSRKTPREIADAAERWAISNGEQLVSASRMSAKVDSAAVQDGFDLYHHVFFFTADGEWCVVQQGMNTSTGWARRYHWLGESVSDFVTEPHQAVQNLPKQDSPSDRLARQKSMLNMVAHEADANRQSCAELACQNPDWVVGEIERLTEGPTLFAPQRHPLLPHDANLPRLRQLVIRAHENHPQDFSTLLGTKGVGGATIRSLALLAEVIFQNPVSRRDPSRSAPDTPKWADYAFAHGGKDGTPFPVDRQGYDRNIHILTEAVRRAKLGDNEQFSALKRLSQATSLADRKSSRNA